MAQGAIKRSARPGKTTQKFVATPSYIAHIDQLRRSNSTSTKPRGSRQIAPKKQKLIAQNKIVKKRTAGMAQLTERKLAEKAGHLEMLRGGKKDNNKKPEVQRKAK